MRSPAEVDLQFDLDRVRAVCSSAAVTVAILYGSRARGDAIARSDVDVAVGFQDDLTSAERTRQRLRLTSELSRVFGTDAVDVVPLSGMSPALRREVAEDGVLLYGDPREVSSVDSSGPRSHEERLREFDEMLAAIRKVV